eukprot:gene52512-63424_t
MGIERADTRLLPLWARRCALYLTEVVETFAITDPDENAGHHGEEKVPDSE